MTPHLFSEKEHFRKSIYTVKLTRKPKNLHAKSQHSSSYSSRDLGYGQTDMASSTRLVILMKNIYTLWSRKRFLLPVTYISPITIYSFSLRVRGRQMACIEFCCGYPNYILRSWKYLNGVRQVNLKNFI